jgi:outer membrane protein assembly factor BamB
MINIGIHKICHKMKSTIFSGGAVNRTTIIFFMLLVLIPSISKSKTIKYPLNYNTIGKAVENSSDGDTVLLADGTHMCTETILIDKAITIKSDGDSKGCTIVFQASGQFRIIQASQSENNLYPKFSNIKFMNADNTAVYCENASPEFQACTFTKNSGDNGGAVYSKNGQPFFYQCYFSKNRARQDGGAFYLEENANATLNECLVYTNTAVNNGGGIFIHKSSPVFVISEILFNTADQGGGIYFNESSPSLGRCILEFNTADTNGGGIFITKSTQMNTYQVNVMNNLCPNGNGGGLYIENSNTITLEKFVIDGNEAIDGAGIYLANSATSVIQQCIIYGNKSSNNGGGVYLKNSIASQLINLLVSENSAAMDAGGVYYENCETESRIIFCTFARNTSNNPIDTGIVYFNKTSGSIINSILWNEGYEEIESINISQAPLITYSNVEKLPYTNNVYPGEGNINKDPLFENKSNKKDDRYLHLEDLNSKMQSSPCINSGKLDDSLPQIDLYDVNRKKHGNSADMGAIEYITRGAKLSATPEFGRDPLVVDLTCNASTQSSDYQSYTYSIDFGDGSAKMESPHGTFTHRYSGGLFHAECTIFLKDNPTIYSIPDSVTINVSSYEWRFNTGGVIESSPAIGPDGSIYIGSDSGAMFGVVPDGTEKWRFQTRGRITSSPAVYSNTVIFGSEDASVYKVNAENGQLVWRFDTYGPVYSSPAIDKSGNIYIGSCDYNLYAITPDGYRKWTFFTKSQVVSSPSIVYYTNQFDDNINTVYVGSHDNHLYALNLETGAFQWSVNVGANIWGSAAISGDRTIYAVGGEAVGAATDNNLFAINPDGSIKWKHTMQRGAYASPVLFSGVNQNQTIGMILIGSYDNMLYALNLSGYEEWAFPTKSDPGVRPSDILSTPAIGSSGTIYFGSENHMIYAIEHEKGSIRWAYSTEGPIYSSPTIHHNILYVGSFDHYLYAIRTNDEALSTSSSWPVYHQNTAHHSCVTIHENTMPPTILKTYPEHNETGLAANVPITLTVTFSKVMDTSTIDISFISAMSTETLAKNNIKFENTFLDDRQVTVASFQPLSPTLEYDRRYKVKISSTAADTRRNKLKGDWIWVFFSETNEETSDSSGMRGCFIEAVLNSRRAL